MTQLSVASHYVRSPENSLYEKKGFDFGPEQVELIQDIQTANAIGIRFRRELTDYLEFIGWRKIWLVERIKIKGER